MSNCLYPNSSTKMKKITRVKGSKLDPITRALLENHNEALVIYLDKHKNAESDIKVFSKFQKVSQLSTVLSEILDSLQRVTHAKQHCETKSNKTASKKKK